MSRQKQQKEMKKEAWYKEGLRFGCTECGKCCTGGPGVVWVSDEEIERLLNKSMLILNLFHRSFINIFFILYERPKNFNSWLTVHLSCNSPLE